MKKKNQPVLTIGIIFKNEIRCLERCLKSLTPLRETVPCELIMADTGADDGSREVAADYADLVFDFPWNNDFSAARNAVMDKAAATWYLTVDADEYLDPDITELAEFLRNGAGQTITACSLIQRNYESIEMNGDYSDFMALRMIRLSLGLRYEGSIHEAWIFPEGQERVHSLCRTILHHDGYAGLHEERGRRKRERNLMLIKNKLRQEPENLAGLLEYIESGRQERDFMEVLRKALSLVEKKRGAWKLLGPPIFRYAVREARERNLPEFKDWTRLAWNWFPDSFFTRIDVEYISFSYYWEQKEYKACISQGKRYLKAVSDYQAGYGERTELRYGSILCGSPYCKQTIMLYLADAYAAEKDYVQSIKLLNKLDCTYLDIKQTENFVRVLWKVHVTETVDTAPALLHFLNESQKPVPNKKEAKSRVSAFYRTAVNTFTRQCREEECTWADYKRPSYTLFLPLGEEDELGCAAMILEAKDRMRMQELLANAADWDRFPVDALAHAIQHGVCFPLPDKPLKLEDMDSLAVRLADDRESFFDILSRTAEEDYTKSRQTLMWIRSLLLIAVRVYNWGPEVSDSSDAGKGIALIRFFARVEEAFLPRYYAPELLREENILFLPVLHRFGWYCIRAFGALNQGSPAGYVHELKAGLSSCPDMKGIVEYLIRHTAELQTEQKDVPPELKLLAKQVKKLLSSYPENDPAVAALRESPAYQKVKELIEDGSSWYSGK